MRGSQLRVAVRAHAKINLDLRIVGSRPDGYHELRNIFQTVALHDTIVCAERPGAFRIECKTRGVPRDRRAISVAPAGSIPMPSSAAPRFTTCSSSATL